MARIMEGAEVASALDERTALKVGRLRGRGIDPTLAIVRVGERDDSLAYARGAAACCARVGIAVESVCLPADVVQVDLLSAIARLNDDPGVHGVLMLLPLPDHLDQVAALAALDPAKDVDGVTETSFASVYAGRKGGFAPCTASACMMMLDYYGIVCEGKHAAVIGSSLVVGRPVAMMLLARDATPTICHIKTEDVPAITREADIVIVATGCTEQIGPEYFTRGQTVIDVGVGWSDEKGRLCGDVVFDEVEPLVGSLSSVPGGVGAVTTSVLASNVADAAEAAS